jgi:hypothetical protein
MTRFGRRLTATGAPSSSVRSRSLRSARSRYALFETARPAAQSRERTPMPRRSGRDDQCATDESRGRALHRF